MDDHKKKQRPTSLDSELGRPLAGMTVLVVEDSRFACESIRLLCLRAGARIRRADSLASARRHLKAYRPAIAIIDMGLPDGSGADLIEELVGASTRIPLILGISGDPFSKQAAISAGADGFIAKPVVSVAKFQAAILALLPDELIPPQGRQLVAVGQDDQAPSPDPLAFQDDMAHVLSLLSNDERQLDLDYVAQFTRGVAKSVADSNLEEAALALARTRALGQPSAGALAKLAALAQDRARRRPAI